MAEARQREYETVYILRPNAPEEDNTKTRERVEGIIENAGGHVLKFDNWGMRKLSYAIRDKAEQEFHERGRYIYYRYLAPSETVAEVERNLRIIDPVIKFMTVKLEADLLPGERLAKPTEMGEIDVLEVGVLAEEEE